jgi:hypothetical protein
MAGSCGCGNEPSVSTEWQGISSLAEDLSNSLGLFVSKESAV